MSLRAEQARDQFQSSPNAESLSGGTSPIQNPDMSYSARAREGGAEAERERQAGMLARGEQFAGAPSMPTGGPSAEQAEEAGEETRAKPEAAPRATTEEDMSVRLAQQAQDYAAESARFSAEVERRAVLMRAQMDEQARVDRDAREKKTAMIWRGLTMITGMTSFTGVGYVGYFALSNARLSKLFGSKKYENIPKPTLPQIVMTLYSDCTACIVGMPIACCAAVVLGACAGAFIGVKLIISLFT